MNNKPPRFLQPSSISGTRYGNRIQPHQHRIYTAVKRERSLFRQRRPTLRFHLVLTHAFESMQGKVQKGDVNQPTNGLKSSGRIIESPCPLSVVAESTSTSTRSLSISSLKAAQREAFPETKIH